jgi:hypothetical protein
MTYAVQQELLKNQGVPIKRSQQGELIFQEIFVKPKQMELEQFKLEKQNELEILLENKETANRLLKY